jgi:alpha-L-rhamnosidase
VANDALTLGVTIPANTTATVVVPAADGITEGGRPLKDAEGIRILRVEGGSTVLEAGSGTYQFAAPMKSGY